MYLLSHDKLMSLLNKRD